MERFSCKTKIISGRGAVGALKELSPQRLMVVTDPFFGENGTARRIAEVSGAKQWELFTHVIPDPTVELAAEGTAALRRFAPDVLVALGGGSAMDLAKAMAFFSGSRPLLVAIPTTSGSGSEVTDFAVLTHGGVKHPLVDEALQPDVAILDGELLDSLPAKLVADCGFDALSHALEAYAATGAGAVSDALAKEAFCTLYGLLRRSCEGDLSVRPRIHEASTMAAMAFNRAGLGLCHAMSHSLGGAFHIPHGRLNAILLPAVLEQNAPAGEKYGSLARAAGLGGSAKTLGLRNLKNGLIRLRKELGLPATLAQAGIDPVSLGHKLPQLIKSTLDDPCCATNPVPVDEHMIRSVLEEVKGGG